MSTRSTRWRITLLAGAGFFLLQLGWLLSIAPGFGIDEFDHAYRASSVAEGHWGPGSTRAPAGEGRGDLIPVRADIVRATTEACTTRGYTERYDCEPERTLPGGEVLVSSAASRYNPAYYSLVGNIAKPFHGTANLVAMRVATALVACLLLLLVIRVAVAGAVTAWPLIVILLAALPTSVYSASIASPNGIELVAGLGVWVALATVVGRSREVAGRTSAYAVLGLCAAVLANTHTLGLFWLALILLVTAVRYRWGHTARALLPRSAAESLVAVLAGAGIAFELLWVLGSKVNDPSAAGLSVTGSPWPYVLSGIVLWPLQAIGAIPMRDEPAPPLVYAVVLALVALLAVHTLRRTGLRSRTGVSVGLVTALSFAVPTVLTVHTFHDLGSAWQGRYGVPFSIGALVLLGSALDVATPSRWVRPLAVLTAVGMPLAHVVGQIHVEHAQRSLPGLAAGTGWAPPGTVLLVLLAAAAAACWALAVGTATAAAPHHPAPRKEAPADDRRPAAVLR